MAELKTKKNEASVEDFLAQVDDEPKRQDCHDLLDIMRSITGAEPAMWGGTIVGFGNYHYRYESGREGDWFLTGFAPRKQNLTVYLMSGLEPHVTLLKKLGKHKTGKCCLYLKRLSDADLPTLKKLIRQSVAATKKLHRE